MCSRITNESQKTHGDHMHTCGTGQPTQALGNLFIHTAAVHSGNPQQKNVGIHQDADAKFLIPRFLDGRSSNVAFQFLNSRVPFSDGHPLVDAKEIIGLVCMLLAEAFHCTPKLLSLQPRMYLWLDRYALFSVHECSPFPLLMVFNA